MWDMFVNSLRLFVRGKLFRDPRMVLRQWSIGFVVSLLLLVGLLLLGVPVWIAVPLVAAGGGALQPWLFKDLKYN
jgi:hypothetical protein